MPHAARPTVTLRDVAAAAGVSVATASRVLGGSSRPVAPEYQRRVLSAAATLRYTADASARAMRRASDSIMLVADDLTTPSIGLVVAAMEREARAAGAFVTVSSTRGTPERQLETVRVLRSLRPRALVLTSARIDVGLLAGRLRDELLAYEREGGRVVIVGDTDLPFHSISFDNRGSAREIGEYLAGSGHRRVTVLGGSPGHPAMGLRVDGVVAGLTAGGVDPAAVRVVACEISRQGGHEAAQRLLEGGGVAGTDAIVAANDLIAIGALAELRAAGVAVPADVSVTGFDDIPFAVDVTPRLTTVALPLAHAGAESIRLAASTGRATRLTMRGHLVVRDSTRVREVR